MEDERKELIVSDLGCLCEPQLNISPYREYNRWASVPYETASVKGSALVAMRDNHPRDVSFDPQLTGWYKIFVGMLAFCESENNCVNVKLSSAPAFMHCSPCAVAYAAHAIQEVYLISADMTGEKFVIGKAKGGAPSDAMISWVRFVPMSDEEAAAFQADQADMKNKRLYATNDMHGMHGLYYPTTPAEWHDLVEDYSQSDVEWLSVENVMLFDGSVSTGNDQNFVFPRYGDMLCNAGIKRHFTYEMLRDLVKFGHEKGLKMCCSRRMGAWGMEFPYDQMYFTNLFREAHPKLRCVDRDGVPVEAVSYMYPETRKYVIDMFVESAKQGFDAVEMIFTRGVPYILFEEPFVEAFQKEYGEDPRELPIDDERVISLKCRFMTDFVRELRAALDEATGKDRTAIHARCHFTMYDSRLLGEDLLAWAKEGLVKAVISYPQRIREVLDETVWKDDDPAHIDIEKYHNYYINSDKLTVYRRQDFEFMPPMEDSKGILQGPKTQAERVKEFMELEKYGTTVYLEIMPRYMSPAEYKRRALDLYDSGCSHISFWDTYGRVCNKLEWSMVRRLGHKDEVKDFADGDGEYYRNVRLLSIAGDDVSRYIPAWGG